jgi:hypothetical protein
LDPEYFGVSGINGVYPAVESSTDIFLAGCGSKNFYLVLGVRGIATFRSVFLA